MPAKPASSSRTDALYLTPHERRGLVHRIEHTLVYIPLYRDECEVLKGILAKLKDPTEGEE
jgi:hypothetical protein